MEPLEKSIDENIYDCSSGSSITNVEDSGRQNEIDLKKTEDVLRTEDKEILIPAEDSYLQQRAFPPEKVFSNPSMELHAKQFLEVMQVYQKSLKDPKLKGLDLRETHSWDDVLRIAKDAEAEYIVAGGKGLRRVGRMITSYSAAVMPPLLLIPNGFFTSIICGGLMIHASSRIGERRDMVLKTLLQIPITILEAEHCVETFPSDPTLYDKAAEVYLAALAAIEGTTRWLTANPALKQFYAMIGGPLYNKSLKEKIESLDESLMALHRRVSTLRDGSIVRTGHVVERVETVLNQTRETGDNVDSTTKTTLSHVHNIQSDVKTLTLSQAETHYKIDHLTEVQQAKEEANRAMKLVLEETTKTSKWMKQKERTINRLKKKVEMLERAAVCLTREDLLEILGVSTGAALQDLKRIRRANELTDLSTDHGAKGIIETPKFKDWLSSIDSGSLFVQGGGSSSLYGRITPLSLMSSVVVEHLSDSEPAVAIYFFCASHTSSNDALRGPQGMMRSLISQLLHLFPLDLDFISRRVREHLEVLNFHILCDCFAKLVKRLPTDCIVFCIIDSICFFEKKQWAEDCRKAVHDLQDLVEDESLSSIFKLLITSPSRSRFVGKTLPTECHLSVPTDEFDGRDAPSEREMSMQARKSSRTKNLRSLLSAKAPPPDSEREESSNFFYESDNVLDSEFESSRHMEADMI